MLYELGELGGLGELGEFNGFDILLTRYIHSMQFRWTASSLSERPILPDFGSLRR